MSRRIQAHPLVVHVDDPHDVVIDRNGPWGNPFRPGPFDTRTSIILRYERWLLSQPDLVERARSELRGKRLACWCRGTKGACHGDILARIANEL